MKKSYLFIILVLGLSWVYTAFIFSNLERIPYFNFIMYVPCLVALGLRIFSRESLKQMAAPFVFYRSGWSGFGFLFSFFYPLLFIFICAWIALESGLAGIDSSKWLSLAFVPPLQWFALSISLIIGEEYGWRGFLLPELTKQQGPLKATVIVGLVWAVWHAPVVYLLAKTLGTADPIALCFIQMAAVFVFSFPFAYCYFLTGSILPPMIFHWVWNLYNPMVLGNIYRNRPGLMTGEIIYINGEGLMGVALGSFFVFWFIFRQRYTKRP